MSEMIKLMKRFGKILLACNSLLLLFSISVPDSAFAQRTTTEISSRNEYISDSPILSAKHMIGEHIALLELDAGAIYGSGRLVGIDLSTGLARWEIEKIDWTRANSFYCNTIVIISEGDYSAGYNLKNGEQLWECTTPIYEVSCESQVGYFYQSYPSELFVVDLFSGEIVWSARVKRLKGAIPVRFLDDHHIAVFQKNGFRIYDIDNSTYWEYRSEKKSNREFYLSGYTQKTFKSSSSFCNTDETILFSNLMRHRDQWYYAGKSRIVSFDLNGKEIWSFKIPNNLKGQVLLHAKDGRLFFINTIAKKYLLNDEHAFALGSLDMKSGDKKGILFYSESEFLSDIEFVGDSLYMMTSMETLLADISAGIQLMNKNKSLMDNLIGKPVAISKCGFEKTSEGFEPLSSGSIYMEDEFGGRLQLSDSSSYAIVDNRDIYTISSCTESAVLFSNLKESWLTDQNYRLSLKKAVSNRAMISGCYLFEIERNFLIYQNICR